MKTFFVICFVSESIKKISLRILALSAVIFLTPVLPAQPSLEKLWESDSIFSRPESVLFDPLTNSLYVSNIGKTDNEGTGSISRIGADGRIINLSWLKGLTAVKGLSLYKNLLYAAQPTLVVVIDTKTASVVKRIPVKGAGMLNDITIDPNGIVYVSDTKLNKIYRIENGSVSEYLDNMNSANGLLAKDNKLYILTGTTLQVADENKKLKTIASGIEGGADGIEMVSDHEFLVTGWAGIIYYVKDDGTKQVLSDTRNQKINSADLGYDPASKTLYIPEMMSNKVAAYRLK
jgi:DNA-binding beta-propeller fold protein YncE